MRAAEREKKDMVGNNREITRDWLWKFNFLWPRGRSDTPRIRTTGLLPQIPQKNGPSSTRRAPDGEYTRPHLTGPDSFLKKNWGKSQWPLTFGQVRTSETKGEHLFPITEAYGTFSKRWIVDRATLKQARADDLQYVDDPAHLDFLAIYFANGASSLAVLIVH